MGHEAVDNRIHFIAGVNAFSVFFQHQVLRAVAALCFHGVGNEMMHRHVGWRYEEDILIGKKDILEIFRYFEEPQVFGGRNIHARRIGSDHHHLIGTDGSMPHFHPIVHGIFQKAVFLHGLSFCPHSIVGCRIQGHEISGKCRNRKECCSRESQGSE